MEEGPVRIVRELVYFGELADRAVVRYFGQTHGAALCGDFEVFFFQGASSAPVILHL
jgi:hypothetical protein